MGPSHPSNTSGIERLLIVRLSAMGDIIHALPAATALRQAFPAATIGWVVEERWAELLCTLPTARSGPRSAQRPLADRIHTVNLKPWRRSLYSFQTWEQIAAAISEIRGVRYQVAIDFQGAARSALLARWSGAPITYGAVHPRENVAGMVYTRRVPTQGEHVVEHAMSLARAVSGQTVRIPDVQFPRDETADRECDQKLAQLQARDFALLNPGAGWGAKQWPAERYGQVARVLAKDGIRPLVNFGPGEEGLARTVETASGNAAIPIACSLTQLMSLTCRARLFIGGDTGPLHLAAAFKVPVVGIYGPTNPARNGPYCTRCVVLRSSSSITSHARIAETEGGLLEITPEQVIIAARKLLGGAHG